MDFPDTPSLAILKSDAKILLRAARDQSRDAIVRLVRQRQKANAVTVENWVYGPRNGAHYKLKFIDGKLVSIGVSRR